MLDPEDVNLACSAHRAQADEHVIRSWLGKRSDLRASTPWHQLAVLLTCGYSPPSVAVGVRRWCHVGYSWSRRVGRVGLE